MLNWVRVTPGALAATSWMPAAAVRSSVSALKAVMAIGTSCSDCSRRWAVTMMSSSDALSSCDAVWAKVGDARPAARISTAADAVFPMMVFMLAVPFP